MNIPERDIQLFLDSLDRCTANPRFMDVFYETFIGASPEVAAKFATTPMKRQKRALKSSLFTAVLAAGNNGAALAHLGQLAQRHRELDIRPELYDLWLESLISAARRCGGRFEERTEKAWRSVLMPTVDLVKGHPPSPAGRRAGLAGGLATRLDSCHALLGNILD